MKVLLSCEARRRRVWLLGILLGGAPWVFSQSLYNENSYRPLAADKKAFRVGDLITVQVIENASATSSADTNTERNNQINAGGSISTQSRQHTGNLSLGIGGTFDGGGTTQRSNRLLATLSATVMEVLPNGEMRIAGEQFITVNSEQHKVHVEGRVRPQDVSGENTVLSNRLADARIDYLGDGDLSKRQKTALWRKCMDWLGF